MAMIPIRPAATAPPAAPTTVCAPWHAARLLTAPHRLGFFAAAVLMATSALWWALALFAPVAGLALPWSVPAPLAHGLVMSGSFMPLFIVGFLFTAGPKWLQAPEVSAAQLLRPVSVLAGGWLVAMLGFHVAVPLAALGVGAAALAWAALVARFVRLFPVSRASDQLHARGVAVAGTVGVLAFAGASLALALGAHDALRIATRVALWGFLAPTFTIVSHRMLPFFTASALPMLDAWRPNALLGALLATLGIAAVSELAPLWWWPLPAAVHAALAVALGLGGALVLWLALRWGLVHSLRVRLLAMLYGGFVWLGIALGLAALSHARIAVWGESATLGLAPLHALSIGYLGATLLAMVTRVAAGHSGRPLVADGPAFALYLAVQAAALLRVGAALWPQAGGALTLAAVVAWGAGCVGWAWRYGGWLGRPRADGRPG
jgi:uncharacterized protein involved in response to NO